MYEDDDVFYDPHDETDYLHDAMIDDRLERRAMQVAGEWCQFCAATLPRPHTGKLTPCKRCLEDAERDLREQYGY